MQKRNNNFFSELNVFEVFTKSAALLLFVALLGGCNSQNKNTEKKQVFLMDSTEGSLTVITDAIKHSEIRKGGYVVIIPSQTKKDNRKANKIEKEFYGQEIMAVHVLNINPNRSLNKTDIIAIENAKIICLVGIKSIKNKVLEKPIENALINNACIIVSNKKSKQEFLQMLNKP